jgi:DNA mismatch repair protein MutS2
MNDIQKNFMEAVEFPRLLERLSEACQTQAGKEALRSLGPLSDAPALKARLDRTRELEPSILKDGAPPVPDASHFQEALERTRTQGAALSGAELSALSHFLGRVVKLRQYLSPEGALPPSFRDWLTRLQALPDLKASLDGKVADKGEVRDDASAELQGLRDSLRALRAQVQDFYHSFLQRQASSEALQERIVTEREGRLVVPVKRDHQSQVPGFVHGLSASGATLFVEPQEILEANNRVKETVLREDEEVRRVLRGLTDEVLKVLEPLRGTLAACAEVDLHSGLALFASLFEGKYLLAEGTDLALKGARHPLLCLEVGEAFRGKVIPLDLEFIDRTRVILVSGPNAGGKTVALKTLGLLCLMAQCGMPVPVREGSLFPALAHFDSDLLDGQSLTDHLSTYAAKLSALKRMMDAAGPGSLLLMDELGAGTDPKEGGALGLACLEVLREKGALVLANTHQPLLKLLTNEAKGMANAAMLFDEASGKPTFRLVTGVPGQSYAFTLARQMGFTEELLSRARGHLPPGEADLSELLAKLGAEKQAAARARAEAERIRDGLRRTETELLTAKRQIKDEAKRIKKEAQVEAEGLLKNTRRKVEHLIQGVRSPSGQGVDKARVNDARREVDRKIRNIAPAPARPVVEVGELKEGDKVYFRPGHCEVTVASADEEALTAVILMGNGLKLSCKYSDLGLLSKNPLPPKPPSRPQATGALSPQALEEKGKLELDLRGRLVDQALPMVDKFLDDALLVGLPFVRIIHGKGTGALKEALHKHLPASHPGLEFALAEPAQGGAGVTVVKFKK